MSSVDLTEVVATLTERVADHPHDPEAYYELGEAHHALEHREAAVAAFEICASLDGAPEFRAWAFFRAGWTWVELHRFERAIEICARGMACHAGMAELPWLAAFAAREAGQLEQALCWAQVAAALGRYIGMAGQVERTGPQHAPAQWEGPFDVLRWALHELGDVDASQQAQQQFELALAARNAAEGERDRNPAAELHPQDQPRR